MLRFPTIPYQREGAGKIAGPTSGGSLPDYKGQGEFPGPNCGGARSSVDSFLFKHGKAERTFCLPAQLKTRFQQNLTTAHHGFAQQPVDQSQEHESKNCICVGLRQNKATCIYNNSNKANNKSKERCITACKLKSFSVVSFSKDSTSSMAESRK